MKVEDRISTQEATEALIAACEFAGGNASVLTFVKAEPVDMEQPVLTTMKVTLCREVDGGARGQPQQFLVVVVPAPPAII